MTFSNSETWRSVPLKSIAHVRSGITKGRPLDGKVIVQVAYLRVANVQDGYVDLHDVQEIPATADEVRRFSLRQGDVLMNEGGDNDKLGRGAVWLGEIEPCLHQNHVFSVRPRELNDAVWIAWCTQSADLKAYFVSRAKQSTNLASISATNVKMAPIPLPPASVRTRVSNFLNKKTAAIDSLIVKKERLIELLQEKRQALITQAVTKGLDPNVPMKDSGVEWLGEIPAHWRAARVKHLMSRIVDCPHSTPEYSADGEYPAIRTADVDRGRLLLEGARRVSLAVYLERVARLVPKRGDVLYSREGERFGMAAVVPAGVDVCLAQRMMMFRTHANHEPEFVMWLLNSEIVFQQVRQDSVGATAPRINIPTISNAWIAVPPRDEQARIADHVNSALVRIDAILDGVRRHCSVIAEYRQALITEAVTGKLDIAQEADRDPDSMVGQALEATP